MNTPDAGVEAAGLVLAGRPVLFPDLPWNPHPAFPGVFLKHLVCGRDTAGTISIHLVRVDPGCRLDAHVHEGQWEVHHVAAGEGQAFFGDRRTEYRPGVAAVIPKGDRHEVRAGETGLLLYAEFVPALM